MHRDAYNAALLADPGPLDVQLNAVHGTLPPDLRGGTWWCNGPAGLASTGRVIHPVDGHGYVRALSVGQDDVLTLRARFVETQAWKRQQETGRFMMDGLGTVSDRPWAERMRGRLINNVANTRVVPWGGAVLTMWTGGIPHLLDRATLQTVGPENFDGALYETEQLVARTRVDPDRGVLVGLSFRRDGFRVLPGVREIDQRRRMVASINLPLRSLSPVVDYFITPRWYGWTETPIRFRPLGLARFALAVGTQLEAAEMAGRPTRLVLVPRGGGPVRELDTGRVFLSLHHAQAWEEGEELVIVTCALPGITFGRELGYLGPKHGFDPARQGAIGQQLLRLRVHPEAGSSSVSVVGDLHLDYPTVAPGHDGRRVGHVYGLLTRHGHDRVFCGVGHVDLSTGHTARWLAPEDTIVGAPVLVPRADARHDGDGWIVTMLSDGARRRSTWCVLDTRQLAAGPVFEAEVTVLLPWGFHATWEAAGAP